MILFEGKVPGLFLKEVSKNGPDDNHNGKEDKFFLGRGDKGGQDVCGNKKLEPEDYLAGKIPPDEIIRYIPL